MYATPIPPRCSTDVQVSHACMLQLATHTTWRQPPLSTAVFAHIHKIKWRNLCCRVAPSRCVVHCTLALSCTSTYRLSMVRQAMEVDDGKFASPFPVPHVWLGESLYRYNPLTLGSAESCPGKTTVVLPRHWSCTWEVHSHADVGQNTSNMAKQPNVVTDAKGPRGPSYCCSTHARCVISCVCGHARKHALCCLVQTCSMHLLHLPITR